MTFIPYGRQSVDKSDIQAVVDVLQSDYLTTGPKVEEFERALAEKVEAKDAVAVSSGTAALHCAMHAIGISPGDEVIVPPITFAATANSVVYQGGVPVFADVDPETLLIDPDAMAERITPRTRAMVAVDYAGQPCDYEKLRTIASDHDIVLIADSCHALGARHNGRMLGNIADLTVFSFHPVKHITTGEGGMITTDNPEYAARMKSFRNHGISLDHHQRSAKGSWFYEIRDLGFNYRITDFQCALGLSQLGKLDAWIGRRNEIARRYSLAFAELEPVRPLKTAARDITHAYHLYVIQLDLDKISCDRNTFFLALRENCVGVNVHYIPVYLHPFYRKKYGYQEGYCPQAEHAYERIISIPMFQDLTDANMDQVIESVKQTAEKYQI